MDSTHGLLDDVGEMRQVADARGGEIRGAARRVVRFNVSDHLSAGTQGRRQRHC